MRANTVFFFQAHGVLFPTTQQSLLLENAIPFSLWLLSLCFFKTHGAADKNKTILRYKQTKITLQNTYSTHRANDKWTQKVLRSYVSYLPWCPLCYPRPEPPSHECWTLGCTSGIRVVCWHWYLGASWAAKTKQTFSLPRKPHFFFIVIITTCCRMSRKVLRLQRLIIIII